MPTKSLSPGAAATLACLYEATAPKPGNVHPGANFDETTTYAHFVQSAVVIGPIIEQARAIGVGRTVLEAVRATRASVGTNTNLGTLLLLVPLAAVHHGESFERGIGDVFARLTYGDTRAVYEAIRLAQAGGLGRADRGDVSVEPPPDLRLVEAMRLAADRDLVARQYTNDFADVLAGTSRGIASGLAGGYSLSAAIVHAHVAQLAATPDSLIGRKCGRDVAEEASRRAAHVLEAGGPSDDGYRNALADFDGWLRADGHRRNPGTTADLIAAGLFVLLREGRIHWTKW
jgi:triphosphoribosyl-dephospho-CoA synthase